MFSSLDLDRLAKHLIDEVPGSLLEIPMLSNLEWEVLTAKIEMLRKARRGVAYQDWQANN